MIKIERKLDNAAEVKLEEIRKILFPPSELVEEIDPETGKVLKYHIDYSTDLNLDAALVDLVDGVNNKSTHDTIKSVVKSLEKIRNILEEHVELSPDANFIVLETKMDEEYVE